MQYPSLLSSNKLKQIRKLKQKKYRNQYDCYLCEGLRLFDAAINKSDLEIRELVISENFLNSGQGDLAFEKSKNKGIAVFITNESTMKSISEDISPPGIVFTVEKMSKNQIPLENIEDNIILYLERISEPGNLGSIIRSAGWFGIKSIMLSPECVDPWNPKSVRASAGAIFGTTMYTDINYLLLKEVFSRKEFQFIATVVSGGTPINKWRIGPKNMLLFGSEADGLSNKIANDADIKLNIPAIGNVESLNLSVAASIIMYEITK